MQGRAKGLLLVFRNAANSHLETPRSTIRVAGEPREGKSTLTTGCRCRRRSGKTDEAPAHGRYFCVQPSGPPNGV